MSNNFNVGQFISNFLQYSAQNIAGKPVTITQQPTFAKPVLVQEQVVTQNLQLKNILEIPKIQMELLNSLDKGALVKDLMNMPKEFTQLISMFTINQGQNQSAVLDIAKMITFLQENGEQGRKNLLNLIVSFNKSGFTQTEQLKELNYIINACVPSSQNLNATIMKNLILLYLPWLPLGEGMGFDIEIQTGNDETSGVDDDSVIIYIQTLNFGSIKILLKVEGKTKILLQIACDEKFPKDLAQKLFLKEVETYNLKTEFEFNQLEQEKNSEEEKNTQTRVNVDTSRHINPLLMMAAHSIIRIVFEIDKNTVEIDSKESEQLNP